MFRFLRRQVVAALTEAASDCTRPNIINQDDSAIGIALYPTGHRRRIGLAGGIKIASQIFILVGMRQNLHADGAMWIFWIDERKEIRADGYQALCFCFLKCLAFYIGEGQYSLEFF